MSVKQSASTAQQVLMSSSPPYTFPSNARPFTDWKEIYLFDSNVKSKYYKKDEIRVLTTFEIFSRDKKKYMTQYENFRYDL